eukprot:SAG31_NODE_88_length_26714_cov_6.972046_2_plen_107_part_00
MLVTSSAPITTRIERIVHSGNEMRHALFTVVQICGEGHDAAQKVILQCTANLAAEEATVMAKLGHYIKALYDADLAEEETINSWFAELENGSAAQKNAASFIKWLA